MTDGILAGCAMIIGGEIRSGLALRLGGSRILSVDADRPAASGRIALPPDAILAPGFIDIQVNGGGGVQFDATPTQAAVHAMAASHRRLGTTAILPTLITEAPDIMRQAASAAAEALIADPHGILGIHFEGPFLSPARPGVHRADLIRPPAEPDLAWLADFAGGFGGRVVMTVAPEVIPVAYLDRLAAANIVVLAGHSAASFEDMAQATAHGLRGCTHIFNAMAQLAARAPGIAAAALTNDALFCGVIADLIHVHPAMLALLLRCKPRDRIMLVSDSMAVAGTELAGFTLQGRKISRGEGRLVTEDGVLAGADLSLAQAVRNMAAQPGVTLAQAVSMASAVPAACLGLHDRGAIAPGNQADLVLLGADLEVLGTWVAGGCQGPAGSAGQGWHDS
jgi:N-acetylglucosamine-6-phosphate deacetylase